MYNQKPLSGDLLDYGNPLAQGLVGCWLFNEGSGTKVFDLSGNENTGTFVGTAPSWDSGDYGSVVKLPGTNEYINVGARTSLQITGQGLTIIARIMLTTSGVNYPMIVSTGSSNRYEFRLESTTDRPIFYINGTLAYSDTALSTNIWYDMVGTYDGAKIRLYQDGKQIKEANQTGNIDGGSASVTIGSRGANYYFPGKFAFVYIYNRVLAPSEIVQLYQEPFCMFRTRRRRIIAPEVGVPPTTFPYYYREIASRRIA